jgi:serine/threonine-protein kinase PpkA
MTRRRAPVSIWRSGTRDAPRFPENPCATGITPDPTLRERFLQEGRTVAGLRHPNIVPVYDSGEHLGTYYLVMAYLPGGTLTRRIEGELSSAAAFSILDRLVAALGYAHAKGIVHRDIKAANVLFDDDDRPILTDFGIATTLQDAPHLTAAGITVGSVEYMSPEQAQGVEVDPRSDLYSLGVLLWQMLTGTLPYRASTAFALARKHLDEPIPRLPPALAHHQWLIDRLLAKTPAERPDCAGALAALLSVERSESQPEIGRTRLLPQR